MSELQFKPVVAFIIDPPGSVEIGIANPAKSLGEWAGLDSAAETMLNAYQLAYFRRYRDQLRAEGHSWEDAECILRGHIWDEIEEPPEED